MNKTEKFIRDYTKNCSNEMESPLYANPKSNFYPWLTPDETRKAVEIAREETLKEVKKKLLIMLNTSVDNSHFFEQLDEYIDELESKQ